MRAPTTATIVQNERLLVTELSPSQSTDRRLSVAELQTLLVDTILTNPYIPHEPFSQQAAFLLDFSLAGFYGGTAGCGKTDVLLMGALQFAEYPDYHALLIQRVRKTPDGATLPNPLLERAREWLTPFPQVKWSEQERAFLFPSGSTITFGHLSREGDVGRYGPYAYQYIGIDGLTRFARPLYEFLKGRLAYGIAGGAPLRIRVGSHPGGLGHEWVKELFVDPETRGKGICFVPALPSDNPYLHETGHYRGLSRLDPRTRARLSDGDWSEPFDEMVVDFSSSTPVDQVHEVFLQEYTGDPEGFALDCFQWEDGEGPTDYQRESLRELLDHRRLSIRGPHGLGKTALAAWIVLWFALTREGKDWKAPCTASAWRQLTHFLFPEIRKWARLLRWERIGRKPFDTRSELLGLSLKLGTGEAFAVASDKSALIEGAHASELLYVFDEAKTIPDETWNAAEGAFASGNCWAIAISTPGEPQGRFYQIHSRKPGFGDWWVKHVKREACVAAGRMSAEWAEQRKLQWGEGSAVYQNRVEGEFASSEADGIIPLTWVEEANERWKLLHDSGEWGAFRRVGVDVARSGVDVTVLALRFEDAIRELQRYAKQDTMGTTGRVVQVLDAHANGNGGEAIVDVIGIGAGVVDRLREQKKPVVAFNASARTDAKDAAGVLSFANQRAAAWWNLRELLDPGSSVRVALPPDDLLTGDLTAPHWTVNSSGRIQVESKEQIKKRLGRSTDDGDAVVMAFVHVQEEIQPNIRVL